MLWAEVRQPLLYLNNGCLGLLQLSLPIISVNIYSTQVLLLGVFLEVNLICIKFKMY